MKRLFFALFENFTGFTIKRTSDKNLPPLTKEDFLNVFFAKVDQKNFFSVQIGAADGCINDPIFHHMKSRGLAGIVVEPQKFLFDILKKNYLGTKVVCVNAAIVKVGGPITLWTVKQDSDLFRRNPIIMGQKASLNRATVEKTITRKLRKGEVASELVEPTMVDGITFNELAEHYGVKNITLLQIDAEGFDWEILKTIDLKHFTPEVISFESNKFNSKTKKEYFDYLTSHSYTVFEDGIDTVAYKL